MEPATPDACPPPTSARERPFDRRLVELSAWAASRAQRSRKLRVEWLALGLILAGLYIVMVASFVKYLTLFDILILAFLVGCACMMAWVENRVAQALGTLASALMKEVYEDPVAPS